MVHGRYRAQPDQKLKLKGVPEFEIETVFVIAVYELTLIIPKENTNVKSSPHVILIPNPISFCEI